MTRSDQCERFKAKTDEKGKRKEERRDRVRGVSNYILNNTFVCLPDCLIDLITHPNFLAYKRGSDISQ